MKKVVISIAVFSIIVGLISLFAPEGTSKSISTNTHVAWWETEADTYKTTFQENYESNVGAEPSLESLQCPIPMKDRVKNYTGIQCVYSSIECLGRWAEEPKLIHPPITSRSDCKGYSSPSTAASKLRKLDVKFEQSYSDKAEGLKLIKKAMSEHRGCLFGVPGHAMVIIHYDEEEDRVCWIDNSDTTLKIQTMSISKFNQRWDTWVLIIYADNDIIFNKIGSLARKIPIIDRNNPNNNYPKDYVPLPD